MGVKILKCTFFNVKLNLKLFTFDVFFLFSIEALAERGQFILNQSSKSSKLLALCQKDKVKGAWIIVIIDVFWLIIMSTSDMI